MNARPVIDELLQKIDPAVSGLTALTTPLGTTSDQALTLLIADLQRMGFRTVVLGPSNSSKLELSSGDGSFETTEITLKGVRKSILEQLDPAGPLAVIMDRFHDHKIARQASLLTQARKLRDELSGFRLVLVGRTNRVALQNHWKDKRDEQSPPGIDETLCRPHSLEDIASRVDTRDDIARTSLSELIHVFTGGDTDLVEVVLRRANGCGWKPDEVENLLTTAHQDEEFTLVVDRRIASLSPRQKEILASIAEFDTVATSKRDADAEELFLAGLAHDMRIPNENARIWMIASPIIRRILLASPQFGAGEYPIPVSEFLPGWNPINVGAMRLVAEIENLLRNSILSRISRLEFTDHPLEATDIKTSGPKIVSDVIRAVFAELERNGIVVSDEDKKNIARGARETVAGPATLFEETRHRKDKYERTVNIDHFDTPLLAYTEIGELEQILLKQFESFEGVFYDTAEVKDTMRRVREIRNAVAHNTLVRFETLSELRRAYLRLIRQFARRLE